MCEGRALLVSSVVPTAAGPGSTEYLTVACGPGWSGSCARAVSRRVPTAASSDTRALYGAPDHDGALSLTSHTRTDTGITKLWTNELYILYTSRIVCFESFDSRDCFRLINSW